VHRGNRSTHVLGHRHALRVCPLPQRLVLRFAHAQLDEPAAFAHDRPPSQEAAQIQGRGVRAPQMWTASRRAVDPETSTLARACALGAPLSKIAGVCIAPGLCLGSLGCFIRPLHEVDGRSRIGTPVLSATKRPTGHRAPARPDDPAQARTPCAASAAVFSVKRRHVVTPKPRVTTFPCYTTRQPSVPCQGEALRSPRSR
jgi:hypothetical protein